MSRLLVRFVVVAAALCAWLVPSRAHAAIIPVCDAPVLLTRMPVPDSLCTFVETIDEETGETSVAPICDPRGASAIAPQRILPVSDATLDVTPGCSQEAQAFASLSPDGGDHNSHAERSLVLDLAVLPQGLPLPPLADDATFSSFEVRGGPRPGERVGVFHPPR